MIFNIKKVMVSVLALAMLITVSSCHKEGTGGKSSVSGIAKHHEKSIGDCVIYIKYGTTEFPGTDVSKYDASVTADGSGNYSFTGLRKGDYYLYGVGYDTDISEAVTGGIAIKLKYNKDVTTNVPVTE